MNIRLLSRMLAILPIFVGLVTGAAENPEIQVHIEEPQQGANYQGVGNLRGWAVAPLDLASVEVYLDGLYQFDVPLGGNR